ncbi:hypothetical protein STENM36S_00957 [Streptomyces tendae]
MDADPSVAQAQYGHGGFVGRAPAGKQYQLFHGPQGPPFVAFLALVVRGQHPDGVLPAAPDVQQTHGPPSRLTAPGRLQVVVVGPGRGEAGELRGCGGAEEVAALLPLLLMGTLPVSHVQVVPPRSARRVQVQVPGPGGPAGHHDAGSSDGHSGIAPSARVRIPGRPPGPPGQLPLTGVARVRQPPRPSAHRGQPQPGPRPGVGAAPAPRPQLCLHVPHRLPGTPPLRGAQRGYGGQQLSRVGGQDEPRVLYQRVEHPALRGVQREVPPHVRVFDHAQDLGHGALHAGRVRPSRRYSTSARW